MLPTVVEASVVWKVVDVDTRELVVVVCWVDVVVSAVEVVVDVVSVV